MTCTAAGASAGQPLVFRTERDPLTSPSPTAECSQAIIVAGRSKATNWDQAIRVTGHGPAAEEIISLDILFAEGF